MVRKPSLGPSPRGRAALVASGLDRGQEWQAHRRRRLDRLTAAVAALLASADAGCVRPDRLREAFRVLLAGRSPGSLADVGHAANAERTRLAPGPDPAELGIPALGIERVPAPGSDGRDGGEGRDERDRVPDMVPTEEPAPSASQPSPARLTRHGSPPGTSPAKLTLDRSTLEKLLERAASAALIAGSIDDPAIDPLADEIDASVHELSELLGNPDVLTPVPPVPSTRSSFAPHVVSPDGAPERVAPDALGASRMPTLLPEDRLRDELAGAPEPSEPGFAFTEDTVIQPHVRPLRPTHGLPCPRVVHPRRPAHGRPRRRVEKAFTTHATEEVSIRWQRSAIATALIALLGVIAFLVLGACGSGTDAGSIRGTPITLVSGTSTGGAAISPDDEIATNGR